MLTIKIGKDIRIQKYLSYGIKLFVKIKNKWFCIKFDNNEVSLLYYIIKLLNKTKE